MSKYNTFLLFFLLSIIAAIVFMGFYLNAIFSFIGHVNDHMGPDPFEIFFTIFSPGVIVSGLIAALSGLLYRILGIVYVAKSKTAGDGEKALWIIGFVLMGFVTGIVFLVMAKGRKFAE